MWWNSHAWRNIASSGCNPLSNHRHAHTTTIITSNASCCCCCCCGAEEINYLPIAVVVISSSCDNNEGRYGLRSSMECLPMRWIFCANAFVNATETSGPPCSSGRLDITIELYTCARTYVRCDHAISSVCSRRVARGYIGTYTLQKSG